MYWFVKHGIFFYGLTVPLQQTNDLTPIDSVEDFIYDVESNIQKNIQGNEQIGT